MSEHRMKTYEDGIQDAIALLEDCRENSIEWLIDRLADYQHAYRKQQQLAARPLIADPLYKDFMQSLERGEFLNTTSN